MCAVKKKVTQTRDLRVGFFVCFCLVGWFAWVLGVFLSDQERSGVRLEILKCESQQRPNAMCLHNKAL